jgi:hypothetical protein
MQATLKKYEDVPAGNGASVTSCDRGAAQRVKAMFSTREMGIETKADGWVIMTFGSDYSDWTTDQRHQMISTFANADACLTGSARNIEFDSPEGRTIARADKVRGIRLLDK